MNPQPRPALRGHARSGQDDRRQDQPPVVVMVAGCGSGGGAPVGRR